MRFPIPRVGLKAHDDRGAGGFTCVGWEDDDTRERVRVRICVRVGRTGGGGMYVRGTYLIRFCCSSRWVGFLGDLSVLSLSLPVTCSHHRANPQSLLQEFSRRNPMTARKGASRDSLLPCAAQ